MEAAGVAFQMSSVAGAAAAVSGAGAGRQFSGGGVVRVCSVKKSIPSLRFCGVAGGGNSNSNNSSSGFCDNGHVEYYNEAEQQKKKKEKELMSAKKTMKKKLKLIKGLSKNLSEFSDMGFGLADSGLTHQVKGKMISEAAELLLGQLQQLRAEEMELKRKKKEDKAKLKATRMMQKRMDDSSSSSSDSECGEEVVDMSRLKSEASTGGLEQQQMAMSPLTPLSSNGGLKQQQMAINQESISLSNTEDEIRVLGNKILGENSSSSIDGNMMGLSLSRKKIEVCMGGKCKKSGAALLLEEFTKAVGGSEGGDVVGCKCMGKCRDGPNVRVVNNGEMDKKPLCIGVGLEDVGLIVSNFIGAGTGSNHLSQPQPAASS